MTSLVSRRWFNPANEYQPPPELPQPWLLDSYPTLLAQHTSSGGAKQHPASSASNSQVITSSPSADLHRKNSSSPWETQSLPCTVLQEVVLPAVSLPFAVQPQRAKRRNYQLPPLQMRYVSSETFTSGQPLLASSSELICSKRKI